MVDKILSQECKDGYSFVAWDRNEYVDISEYFADNTYPGDSILVPKDFIITLAKKLKNEDD